MSPISPLVLQRRMRQLGRIRTGNQVAADRGGRRPNKLDTFRLTSPSKELVEAAAAAFGGTVQPWDNGGSPEFEVITERDALDIVVLGEPVSQWFELWSAAGCLRRCDGITNVLTDSPCDCPDDVEERVALAKKGEACKATTRVNVILPDLPDIGSWRLDAHGYYAAVEMAGTADVLAMATANGRLIPARLRLEQREKKIPGKPTNKYAVPVIELTGTKLPYHLLTAASRESGAPQIGSGATRLQLAAGRPPLPSVAPPDGSDFRAQPRVVGPGADDGLDADTDSATTGDTAVRPSVRPLTTAELKDELERLGVDLQTALARSRVLFPRGENDPLTGDQRAALVDDLSSKAVAAL